jgi:hypothetical protein
MTNEILLVGCLFIACADVACAPATSRNSRRARPQTQPEASVAAPPEPSHATIVPRSDDAGWGDDDGGVCWTVGRVEERVDTIIGRDIVVIGYAHESRMNDVQLADSRGETRWRLPIHTPVKKCGGLVKVKGRVLREVDDRHRGPSFILRDDGVPFSLETRASACTTRDDCIGIGDYEDGGRAPCTAVKYRGLLDGVVSLKELNANPNRFVGHSVLVSGVVRSQRTAHPVLHVTEQHDGEFVVREIFLESIDRELRRQISECDGVHLQARGRVQVVGSGAVLVLQVDAVGLP